MDSQLNELKQSLELAVEGMSPEQWSCHPPGKWCAAEVLEHLYLTYTGTIKGLGRVMAHGAPLATKPTMAQRFLTFVVMGLGRIPAGRQAPRIVQPKGLSLDEVRSNFASRLVEMDALIAQCETRFGRRVKLLDHPILGPLTAPQWRKLHVVHGRHHRKQILRLREGARAV